MVQLSIPTIELGTGAKTIPPDGESPQASDRTWAGYSSGPPTDDSAEITDPGDTSWTSSPDQQSRLRLGSSITSDEGRSIVVQRSSDVKRSSDEPSDKLAWRKLSEAVANARCTKLNGDISLANDPAPPTASQLDLLENFLEDMKEKKPKIEEIFEFFSGKGSEITVFAMRSGFLVLKQKQEGIADDTFAALCALLRIHPSGCIGKAAFVNVPMALKKERSVNAFMEQMAIDQAPWNSSPGGRLCSVLRLAGKCTNTFTSGDILDVVSDIVELEARASVQRLLFDEEAKITVLLEMAYRQGQMEARVNPRLYKKFWELCHKCVDKAIALGHPASARSSRTDANIFGGSGARAVGMLRNSSMPSLLDDKHSKLSLTPLSKGASPRPSAKHNHSMSLSPPQPQVQRRRHSDLPGVGLLRPHTPENDSRASSKHSTHSTSSAPVERLQAPKAPAQGRRHSVPALLDPMHASKGIRAPHQASSAPASRRPSKIGIPGQQLGIPDLSFTDDSMSTGKVSNRSLGMGYGLVQHLLPLVGSQTQSRSWETRCCARLWDVISLNSVVCAIGVGLNQHLAGEECRDLFDTSWALMLHCKSIEYSCGSVGVGRLRPQIDLLADGVFALTCENAPDMAQGYSEAHWIHSSEQAVARLLIVCNADHNLARVATMHGVAFLAERLLRWSKSRTDTTKMWAAAWELVEFLKPDLLDMLDG